MFAIQPSIPAVYGEPVEEVIDFEDYLFDQQTDELLRFVNRHAAKVVEEKQRARQERRRKIKAGLSVALFSSVTFFTAVGITTVFHWIFG